MGKTQSTRTTEGRIPHFELLTNHGIIRAPVKIVKHPDGGVSVPLPLRDHRGALVYALPGGGEFSP